MFIEVEDLAGETTLVNTLSFLKARKSYGDFEPSDATILQLDDKRMASNESLEDIINKFRQAIPLAEFHVPVGPSVWIHVDRIRDVRAASSMTHHPSANAVISIVGQSGGALSQQVRETVSEVQAILINAGN